MGRVYLRLLTIAVTGSLLAPVITIVASRYVQDGILPWLDLPVYMLIALAIGGIGLGLRRLLSKRECHFEDAAAQQSDFILRELPDRWAGASIAISAGAGLFLELAVIRWQATIFPFFAFYKNLSLLACFAGLGLGYALGRKHAVPLFLTLPLLGWQFLFMSSMRYGMTYEQFQSLYSLPFHEQLNMGLPGVARLYSGLQNYYMLAVVFLLTAIAFIPVGQLCGNLMERRERLTAYGLNLLGSLGGVLMMFLVSAYWLPPAVWFLLAGSVLLLFHARTKAVMTWGVAAAIAILLVMEWPAQANLQKIYSPYQLLEVGRTDQGLSEIRAAGTYYQRIYDFSRPPDNLPSDSYIRKAREYYELPYQILRPKSVAVVGAGTGNDVAAALRGGAQRVDAIEIDPAILMLGREGHPEHPYQDGRVHAVANDARSFLRTTDRKYDLIVFGLLDSHTLLSQSSSVRLDSFVYTVQAMREARARLNQGGVISLAFTVLNDPLGRKIYRMLQEAFDGRPPVAIQVGYDHGVVFLQSDEPVTIPANLTGKGTTFWDKSSAYANPAIHADVSTDDWPFFYMPVRVYPVSYVLMALMVLGLSVFLFSSFASGPVRVSNVPFFLLGAGFMLVETKGITELGLTFGNSWQVIGVVIAGIMVMAFLANLTVRSYSVIADRDASKSANRGTTLLYSLLLTSLAIGWWVAKNGGLPSNLAGRAGTAVLLTAPLFFSGMIFSVLLKKRGEISGAMSANLFGAMCGGLLEYNSMYFGFRFLYVMAGALYLAAWVVERAGSGQGNSPVAPLSRSAAAGQ